MSNIERFENLKQIVKLVQPQFEELASIHKAVNYKREASFALQILQENDYTALMAMSNQDSLKRAIINVAAIGLTLSPVHRLAYLVPRKGKICLDISYLGYIQLAIDVGSIKWAVAEIVYKNDLFKMRGLGIEPLHEYEAFSERGPIVGVYCAAKTHDGDYITTRMTIDEVYSIRNRSESWIAEKSSPWKSDESEMIKKSVVRRAYKSWPKTNTRSDRFERAIDVTNEADPIDFNAMSDVGDMKDDRDVHFKEIRESLAFLDRTEDQFNVHLTTVNRREIKKLDDLTDLEISYAKIQLKQWVEAKKQKEQLKIEVTDENNSSN